jgi:hypothetical protein
VSQSFRLRFRLTGASKLSAPETELRLASESDGEPGDVTLRGLGLERKPIQASSWLVVEGAGYDTAEAALVGGDRWRGILETALAAVNLGADFGDRAPMSVLTDAGARLLSAERGEPVVNDVHGLMTFDTEARPRFMSSSAEVAVGRAPDQFLTMVRKAREVAAAPNPKERLAFELFSASSGLATADARFVMLMMAIETLIELEPRSAEAQAHVEALIAATRRSELPRPEKQSMIGTLSWLKDESISQGGRRLAARLEGRAYDGVPPAKFFTKCYELRSRLVHGAYPRPSFEEVNARCAPLETFVSDLLSGAVKGG